MSVKEIRGKEQHAAGLVLPCDFRASSSAGTSEGSCPEAAQMSRYFPDVLPVPDSCPGLHTYPSLYSGAKVIGLNHAMDLQPGS